jgi:hypothetical protein
MQAIIVATALLRLIATRGGGLSARHWFSGRHWGLGYGVTVCRVSSHTVTGGWASIV